MHICLLNKYCRARVYREIMNSNTPKIEIWCPINKVDNLLMQRNQIHIAYNIDVNISLYMHIPTNLMHKSLNKFESN